CFETHRSPRRPRKASALASRCDAPQHEGERAARFGETNPTVILAERKPSEHQPTAVRNDRRLTFPVSGLFFTGTGATHTCCSHWARKFCHAIRTHTGPWSRRHIRLVVHPSRAARRRRVELGCVGAPAARPSEPRRQIERRSSCDSRVQFDSYPRNLVTKARATGAMPTQLSRQVARRSSFACRGGRLASIAAANAKSYASGVT